MKDGCSGSPPIHDIRELAEVGDAIVGSSGQSGAFVFDTATGELRLHANTAAASAQFSTVPRFQTPDQFYRSRRFGWQDVAAVLVLVAVAGGDFMALVQSPCPNTRGDAYSRVSMEEAPSNDALQLTTHG